MVHAPIHALSSEIGLARRGEWCDRYARSRLRHAAGPTWLPRERLYERSAPAAARRCHALATRSARVVQTTPAMLLTVWPVVPSVVCPALIFARPTIINTNV